jgi:circadian clock protein KaiB
VKARPPTKVGLTEAAASRMRGANASPPQSPDALVRRLMTDRGHRNWLLCLYVSGPDSKSSAAFRNLKLICEEHLAGRYRIQVIDLTKNPQMASDDQIVALPTVERKRPLPVRRVIGDLSDIARVLAGLELPPLKSTPALRRVQL